MNIELICHKLLGALFNGGYQGLLLTAVVWVGVGFWRPAVLLPAKLIEDADVAPRNCRIDRWNVGWSAWSAGWRSSWARIRRRTN